MNYSNLSLAYFIFIRHNLYEIGEQIIEPKKGYFFTQIMEKIKKRYNLKITLLLAVISLLNSTVYGINLSNKTHLRVPVNSETTNSRMIKFMQTYNESADANLRQDIETENINGVNYKINWKNLGNGKYFPGNRSIIKENLVSFLENEEDVERILNEIGFNVLYKDISNVNIHYLASSEKAVFKVTFFSKEGKQLAAVAAKYVDSLDKKERAGIFETLKGTFLVPEFGGWHKDIYYEKWIEGPTVNKIASNRILTNTEIENITAMWIKIRGKAYSHKEYKNRILDMNAKNIMYKITSDVPDFIVVDIFGGNRNIKTTPGRFIYDILTVYTLQNKINDKSKAHPKDIQSVLKGIYKGFDYDKIKTEEFLQEALGEGNNALKNLNIKKDINEFIKNELDKDDMQEDATYPNDIKLNQTSVAVETTIQLRTYLDQAI